VNAVVTGGSRGVGRAIAQRLAAGGWTVTTVARTDADIAADDLLVERRQRGRCRSRAARPRVRRRQDGGAAVHRAARRHGRARLRDQSGRSAADLVARIATGECDSLVGRYVHASHDDLDDLLARAEEIEREDLYVLRLRK
jgi:NAD(P)-dependent dehydrogenase (short-subunit alcohol dehydrogenase family)